MSVVAGIVAGRKHSPRPKGGFLPSGEAPDVPQNLAATAVSSSQIDLTWDSVDGGVEVTASRTIENTGGALTDTLSFSHDHASGNLLVLGVGSGGDGAVSATYDGVSLTEHDRISDNSNPPPQQSALLSLADPASGVNTVSITAPADDNRIEAFALSIANAGAVRAASATNSGSGIVTLAVAIPAAVGDLVIAHFNWRSSSRAVDSVTGADQFEDDQGVNGEDSRGVIAWALVDGDEAQWDGSAYTITLNLTGDGTGHVMSGTGIAVASG